jgi:hypothetical protein
VQCMVGAGSAAKRAVPRLLSPKSLDVAEMAILQGPFRGGNPMWLTGRRSYVIKYTHRHKTSACVYEARDTLDAVEDSEWELAGEEDRTADGRRRSEEEED